MLAIRPVIAQESSDTVALTGSQLTALLGAPIAALEAVAVHDSSLTAVHVQVDQRYRDAAGTWHYYFEAGEDPRPAPTAQLTADDLVLLAVSDGGERAQPAPVDTMEIEVTDARGASHWFYLRRGALPGPVPLITYDAAADGVRGQDYALGFSRSGAPVIETLVLGDPEHGANILDRSKARLDVDLALGIGRVSRTEEDVRVRTTGLHIGPLRIIRECEVRGRMLLGLYSPPVRDNFIFYPHGFVLPTTIRLTSTARLLIRNVTLRISMDLLDASDTLTFQSAPEMATPIPIDGHGGQRGGAQPIGWYLLRRRDIGLLGWLQAPTEIAADVVLYYRDERSHPDPPERVAGEFGDHGFLFRHHGPLLAGDVRLSSYGWIMHGTQLDRPAAELRSLMVRPTVRPH